MEQAPNAMASAADRADTIDSSRQTGVRRISQRRVPAQVVLGQRLLDQEQTEIVEARQVPCIREPVRRVGVDLERDVAEPRPHRGDRARCPTPARS
jgi:hypothetical protein